MSNNWSINTQWESIAEGCAQEKATFCTLEIRAHDELLTQAFDLLAQSIRNAPFVSAYPMALWLATNWWRLRWEPRKASIEWRLTHHMKSIGEGYLWPNIDICSDGQSVSLNVTPMSQQPVSPLRYISDGRFNVSAQSFEAVTNEFIERTISRLELCSVDAAELKNLWLCVQEERQVESLARWRKLEAMLGKDPDEMEQSLRHELECEAQDLGFDAVGELASATQTMRPTQLVEQLRRIRNVSESGTSCSESSLSLPTDFFQNPMKQEQVTKPWMVGVRAAQAVRAQQGVGGDQCVSSRQIEDMLGCQEASLLSEGQVQNETGLEHSFILKNTNNSRKIVFRKTNYLASRRFDAARLLGDQLLFPSIQESLRPATVSYTHRQKTQRAFASELLCPFDALDEMFAGNYESDEIQEAVANRFQVSPLLIRTQLVNHQKLDREFI